MKSTESAPLAEYVERGLCDAGLASSLQKRVFDYGICHRLVRLKADRINHVLVFPGSFNPPHRGHQELLSHAYSQCQSRTGLNVVAAIILPLDDASLTKKSCGREDFLLTKTQRCKLWTGPLGLSDWFWVFGFDTDVWRRLQTSISQNAASDGFDIDFFALTGPDSVDVYNPPPPGVWGCKSIIISDVSRASDLFDKKTQTLTPLQGYTPWTEVDLDYDLLH